MYELLTLRQRRRGKSVNSIYLPIKDMEFTGVNSPPVIRIIRPLLHDTAGYHEVSFTIFWYKIIVV